MSKHGRKSLTHLAPKIAQRDGGEWVCHYCGKLLIPPGTPEGTEPYYQLKMRRRGMILYGWGMFDFKEDADWQRKAEAYENGTTEYYSINMETADGCGGSPVIDHVIPLSKGGSNDLDNLVMACRDCNQAKLDRDYAEFVMWMQRKNQGGAT